MRDVIFPQGIFTFFFFFFFDSLELRANFVRVGGTPVGRKDPWVQVKMSAAEKMTSMGE